VSEHPLVQTAILAITSVVALIVHEAIHLLVARAFGYPPICWGVSPRYFGIVFRDQPTKIYWTLQVMLPLIATASVIHIGFFLLPPMRNLFIHLLPGLQSMQLAVSVVLALATSSADIYGMLADLSRPKLGLIRITRNMELLLRESSLVGFTAYGRQFVSSEFGMSHDDFAKSVTEDR
jgi:hypothetical protein